MVSFVGCGLLVLLFLLFFVDGTDIICIPDLRCCLYCIYDKCCRQSTGHLCGHCFTLDMSHTAGEYVGSEALIVVVVHRR